MGDSELVLRVRNTGHGYFMRYQWFLEQGPIQLNYGYAISAKRAERKGRRAAEREARKQAQRQEWTVELDA